MIDDHVSINNTKFYFDYQNGKYGFNTDPSRGIDTFSEFGSSLDYDNDIHYETVLSKEDRIKTTSKIPINTNKRLFVILAQAFSANNHTGNIATQIIDQNGTDDIIFTVSEYNATINFTETLTITVQWVPDSLGGRGAYSVIYYQLTAYTSYATTYGVGLNLDILYFGN